MEYSFGFEFLTSHNLNKKLLVFSKCLCFSVACCQNLLVCQIIDFGGDGAAFIDISNFAGLKLVL